MHRCEQHGGVRLALLSEMQKCGRHSETTWRCGWPRQKRRPIVVSIAGWARCLQQARISSTAVERCSREQLARRRIAGARQVTNFVLQWTAKWIRLA